MNKLAVGGLGLVLVLMLGGCGITASSRNEGYADLDGLSWRDVDTTTTLSFGPTLLSLAASFVEDDPRTRALLRDLDGVRVKIYAIEGDPVGVASDLNAMSSELGAQGWEPVALVREDGETTHVLVKTADTRIAGITVMTSDGKEVVLVNVMGELRPEMFDQTMVALNAPVPAVMSTQSDGEGI